MGASGASAVLAHGRTSSPSLASGSGLSAAQSHRAEKIASSCSASAGASRSSVMGSSSLRARTRAPALSACQAIARSDAGARECAQERLPWPGVPWEPPPAQTARSRARRRACCERGRAISPLRSPSLVALSPSKLHVDARLRLGVRAAHRVHRDSRKVDLHTRGPRGARRGQPHDTSRGHVQRALRGLSR